MAYLMYGFPYVWFSLLESQSLFVTVCKYLQVFKGSYIYELCVIITEPNGQ